MHKNVKIQICNFQIVDMCRARFYELCIHTNTRGTFPGVALRPWHSLGRHRKEPGSPSGRRQEHLDLRSRLCDAGSLSPDWEKTTGGGCGPINCRAMISSWRSPKRRVTQKAATAQQFTRPWWRGGRAYTVCRSQASQQQTHAHTYVHATIVEHSSATMHVAWMSSEHSSATMHMNNDYPFEARLDCRPYNHVHVFCNGRQTMLAAHGNRQP